MFLQLKKDILDGRLVPPLKSAAVLASYAAQCEYHNELETVSLLLLPFYGHYTGQLPLAGTRTWELEDFDGAKFYNLHTLADGN